MKVSELLNEAAQGEPGQGGRWKSGAYYAPSFKTRGIASGMGKIRGSVPDWLEGMGVSKEDIAEAYKLVKKTPEYKAVLDLGLNDESNEREQKNGTLNFVGRINSWDDYRKIMRPTRVRYKVLANGKIDSVAPNDWNRYDLPVPKPRMVAGNPVQTVVKTMTSSLGRLYDVISKRKTAAEKASKKGQAK